MKTITRKTACTLAFLALAAPAGFALSSNMALPYADKCSGPQTPVLAFYSKTSDDLLFNSSEPIDIMCQAGLRSVGLHWALSRNTLFTPFRQGEAEALPPDKFRIRVETAGLLPGFYDLRVALDSGTGKATTGVCTFGYRASEMPLAQTRPADFKQFWDTAKAKLAKIPLDAQLGEMTTYTGDQINQYNLQHAGLPGDYDPTGHVTDTVESCKVSFAGPDGGRVYAWLAKPKGNGPFPVMLVLPGAGFNARPRPLEHARHGYLALDVQVHGQDVDLPVPEYPKIPGYYGDWKFEPASDYYFYNIHLRVLQAVNYLASRPDADLNRLVAAGGSQGGRLSLVIAGLDPRIRAIVPCIAHSANIPFSKWAEACNGSVFQPDGKRVVGPKSDGMSLTGAPPVADTPEMRCMAYYDTMNFAPDIHCPVMMNGGLVDGISPPSAVWGAYMRIGTTDKSITPLPGLGHDWSAEFDRRAWRWLDKVWASQAATQAK